MTPPVPRLRARALVAAHGPELASAFTAWASARYAAGAALSHGFPLDDAWIHMVYGLAVVREGSLAYNDGVPATGCTSPLWALVAGLAHALAWRRAPSMVAALLLKQLGMAAHAAAAALAARLARPAVQHPAGLAPALAAGLLVATCPVLAYAACSGMEVALASALMLATLLHASRGRALAAGTCAGAAFLARPEALVVAGPALAVLCVGSRGAGVKAVARRALVSSMPIAAAVAALVARDVLASGRPLPATFYAKAAVARDPIVAQIRVEAAWDLLRPLLPFAPVVRLAVVAALLAAPAGWLWARGRRPSRLALSATAAAASAVLYALVVAFMVRIQAPAAFYFQRYFAPALPLALASAAMAAAAGGAWLVERTRRIPRRALIAGYGLLVAVAGVEQLRRLPAERARYERDAASIDAVQVAEGRWLAAALPPDATVWAMDAGGPRYWGRRRTVDLGRLNTPELFERDTVRAGWDADVVAVLDGAVRLSAPDGPVDGLELVAGFPSRAPGDASASAPGDGASSNELAPRFTQVVWRCRAAGPVRIDGYPAPLHGRCRK